MNFKIAADLSIPYRIKKEILNLDLSDLVLTTTLNRWVVIKELVKSRDFNLLDYCKQYGFFFEKIGVINNYCLPPSIATAVAKHYKKYFGTINEEPIIRLQVMYGGTQIPMHIDLTRSVSLIIPVANHSSAVTNFYSASRSLARGLINPADCKLSNSVTISKYPALLDVDQVHSVNYDLKSLTKTEPRISLNLKWPTVKFNELANCVK